MRLAVIVDDEGHVRQLATIIFTRAGFETLCAADASEALSLFEEGADVAVLFTDCDMPGMKGPELATVVRDRWPHVRLMLTSGKPFNHEEMPSGAEFVHKPFRPSTLVPRLKEIADALSQRDGFPEQDCA